MAAEIYKKDLYEILGVSATATDKELVKGYRKRALKCHPDKNPGNSKATEQFLELSKALEILTDIAARAAYDQSRKAKKAAEERNTFLDVKRKKFKDDLEAREKAFENTKEKTQDAAEKALQREIERLRKEGSRLLQEEQERLRRELKKTHAHDDTLRQSHDSEIPRIKLKWKAQKSDSTNGGYSAEILNTILSCYGQINTLIVSNKRNGSAIVEFEKSGVDCDILDEVGLKDNNFTIIWLSGKPTSCQEAASTFSKYTSEDNVQSSYKYTDVNFVDRISEKSEGGFPECETEGRTQKYEMGASVLSDRSYESLVLMKMRQAEERKRLIEQMKEEDNGV